MLKAVSLLTPFAYYAVSGPTILTIPELAGEVSVC